MQLSNNPRNCVVVNIQRGIKKKLLVPQDYYSESAENIKKVLTYTPSFVTLSVSLFHVPTTEHIFSLWWLYEQEPMPMFSATAGKCVPFISEGEKLSLQPSGRTQLAYHHIQYMQLTCLFFSQKHFSITLKMCCPILNNTIHFSPNHKWGWVL